jgi:hypothetical protein
VQGDGKSWCDRGGVRGKRGLLMTVLPAQKIRHDLRVYFSRIHYALPDPETDSTLSTAIYRKEPSQRTVADTQRKISIGNSFESIYP